VTFFGIATADNHVRTPIGETQDDHIPIYDFPNSFGFIIVAEGRPGTNNRPLATCGLMGSPGGCGSGRAAVQILADRQLGNGSAKVCDTTAPTIGGVPAVPALDFGPSQMVSDAINDLACRFDLHATSETACTLDDLGNNAFLFRNFGETQYCTPVVGSELSFAPGLTRLKVQIQDASGTVGNQKEIAVQVP
jgi:hypothetical protein